MTTTDRERIEQIIAGVRSYFGPPTGGNAARYAHESCDAIQAALTREQREGVHGTKDCGMEQSARAVFVPCDCGCGRQCCAHCGTDLGFVQEKPQQEAPGAAAFQHKWDDAGETCVHCGDKDWMGDKCSGPRTATPPAPVDVRVAELIAAAVAWWKAHRPLSFNESQHLSNPTINCPTAAADTLAKAVCGYLLDGQPAGVDDEAARKAVGDVFKNLPKTGSPKHHGRFG